MNYYVVSPAGIFPVRCHGTAVALARALGGIVTTYDPRLVFIPPERYEAMALAA
jgi:hypothetical protein